jgi:hypothetical protein
LQAIDSQPIAAGSSAVELRLAEEPKGRVGGRVTDRHGVPLNDVGVEILLRISAMEAPARYEVGASQRTDANGEFVFASAPILHTQFRTSGDEILTEVHPANGPSDASAIKLTVRRRMQLLFKWSGMGEEPHWIVAKDVVGDTKPIHTYTPGSTVTRSRQRLRDGESHLLSVSEEVASVCVYSSDGRELAQIPVQLREDVLIVTEY